MTLSEIETILEELASRHPDLTTELLTTMLMSAGWENKNIQDAVILFKRDAGKRKALPLQGVVPAPSSYETPSVKVDGKVETLVVSATPPKEEITFYLPDGTEEGELHPLQDVPVIKQEEKKEVPVQKVDDQQSSTKIKSESYVDTSGAIEGLMDITKPVSMAQQNPLSEERVELEKIEDISHPASPQRATPMTTSIPTISLQDIPQLSAEPEQDSVIIENNKQKISSKPNRIPEDLPLIPFESSPHIWSFARYKNVFHADVVPEEEVKAIEKSAEHIPMLQGSGQSVVQKIVVMPTQEEHKTNSDDEVEEILLEKTPMTKGDESLVFLAGLMLLAIILILGYMYSNGRL